MKKTIKQIENGKYFEKSLEKFFWMNCILSDVERLDFIYKARNIIITKKLTPLEFIHTISPEKLIILISSGAM